VAREDGEEADELAVRGPRRAVAGSSSSGAPSQAMEIGGLRQMKT